MAVQTRQNPKTYRKLKGRDKVSFRFFFVSWYYYKNMSERFKIIVDKCEGGLHRVHRLKALRTRLLKNFPPVFFSYLIPLSQTSKPTPRSQAGAPDDTARTSKDTRFA